MNSLMISIIYCAIILGLFIIRKHQKKYISAKKESNKIMEEFKNIDLSKLQNNYQIINKVLDNVNLEKKAGKSKYDNKKAC